MKTIRIEKWLRPVAVVAATTLAITVVGCSEDDPAAPPPVPQVNSVTPTTVSPGDTVAIAGADFATPHGDNNVYFNNPLRAAVPFEGSATSLRVVVPNDAATGPVRVSVPEQPESGVGPKVTVNRGVGDVWVFAGTGDGYKLELPFPGGGVNAEYLLVPHGADAGAPYTQDVRYDVSSGEAPSPSPPAPGAASVASMMTVRERFDGRLRRDLEELTKVTDGSALAGRNRTRGAALAPAAPAQFEQFNVLNNAVGSTTNASNYTQVTAELRYPGQYCLIYSDVDTLAGGNLTQADFNDLGQFFDTQGFPSDTLYFGRESDVDNNGKVIILVSGVINALPTTDPRWTGNYFIGGFFSTVDLFRAGQSGVPQGTTNEAEIFYVIAADPTGQYLPGFNMSRNFVVEENKQTLVHEFQHLISFSYRIFNFGLSTVQKTWLEEGMAHMAEDLVGRNSSNENRANLYLAKPDTISLENDSAPLNQRGGIYLFLRWLGDRFGEDIYIDILQNRCAGRACVESITGENFYDTFADFLATLYLSGRGITSDSKYRYSSIDLLADFQPLQVGSGQVGGQGVSGSVLRTSGEHYLFTNPGGSEGEFTFGLNTGSGLRCVVVRTR